MHRAARSVVIDFAEQTDPGRDPGKQINEDASACAECAVGLLLVVCDGMGGHVGGREASHVAIKTVLERAQRATPDETPQAVLRDALERAGRAVYEVGGPETNQGRPGSTIVAALLHERGVDMAHVGDSRLYMLRSGQLYRLTRDHSMVQSMVDSGMISADEAADHPESNIITRALGMQATVEVDVRPDTVPLFPGDVILLCSDGLTDLARDPELLSTCLSTLPTSTAAACSALVDLANHNGGYDNITVQIARLEDPRVLVVHAPPQPTLPQAPPIATQPLAAREAPAAFKGTLPMGTDLAAMYGMGSAAPTLPGAPPANAGFGDHGASFAGQPAPFPGQPAPFPGQPAPFPQAHAAPAPTVVDPVPVPYASGPAWPTPEATQPPSSRGRWLVVGAVLLVLFIVGLVIAWWLGSLFLARGAVR